MRVVVLLSSVVAADAYTCPGSPHFIHASSKQTTQVSVSCVDWFHELQARVDGQPSAWHDPHNNGIYTITESGSYQVSLERLTGDKKYTDKMIFTFAAANSAEPGCIIEGCSESQVLSVFDYSASFCNLRMLTCGSSDGCVPVGTDYQSTVIDNQQSIGSSNEMTDCLKAFELAADKPNIVELAQSQDDLSTLVAAVVAGDLVETLSSPGPFTVFAPTNGAFASLPDGTLDTLLKPENKDQLVDILTYHVLPAQVLSTDLIFAQWATTVEGKNLSIIKSDLGVFVGPNPFSGKQVIAADNLASNGVVHIIDGVLLPPSKLVLV